MLGFVFPGQGSQVVGMGKALSERYPVAAAVFEEADQALGFRISRLAFEGPDEELRRTANCQPAILASSIALVRVLEQEAGLVADAMAGHSLGEFTALVAAGSIGLADAIRLVHRRGVFMQEAVPEGEGAMAAITGLDPAIVEDICRRASQGRVVAPSNRNGPRQVVVAGHADAVDRVKALAGEQGGAVKMLAVSAPFHCELMRPAAERLARELASVAIGAPACPVIANVDATAHGEPDRIRAALVRQVAGPVLWEDCVTAIRRMGVEVVLEIGSSGMLRKMIDRIDPGLEVVSISSPEDVDAIVPRARGRVWNGTGYDVDLKRFTRTWRDEGWTVQPNGVQRSGDGRHVILPNGAEWRFDDEPTANRL